MLCPLQRYSSKSVEANESLKTIGMPSCIASTPACSVSHSACFGLHSPSDRLPCSNHSCASSSWHLCTPSIRASCSSDQGLPEPFYSNGSGSVSSLLHTDQATVSAQGSNTLGFMMVAFLAPPASSTLTVLLMEAGADADWHMALAGYLCISPYSAAAMP